MLRKLLPLLTMAFVAVLLPALAMAQDEKKPEGPGPQIHPQGPNPQIMFQRLDVNHDGVITPEEIPEGMPQRLKELLKRADRNGDRQLTLGELQAAFRAVREQRARAAGPEARPQARWGQGPEGRSGPGPQGRMAWWSEGRPGPGPQGRMAWWSEERPGPGPQARMAWGSEGRAGPGPQGRMAWWSEDRHGPGPQARMAWGSEGRSGPGVHRRAWWYEGPRDWTWDGRPGGRWERSPAERPGGRPGWGPERPGWGPPWAHGPWAEKPTPPWERGMVLAAYGPPGPGANPLPPPASAMGGGAGVMPRLKVLFDRLDRNHDGKLEFREFASIARIFGKRGPAVQPPMVQSPKVQPPKVQPPSLRVPPVGPHVPAITKNVVRMPPTAGKAQIIIARLKATSKDHYVLAAKAEIKKAIQILENVLRKEAPPKPREVTRPGEPGPHRQHERLKSAEKSKAEKPEK
jgi:hypothetical protein